MLVPAFRHLLANVGVPQVLLDLPHIILSKLLLRVLSAHAWWHNDILSGTPVDGSSNALLVRKLKSIDDAEHLRRVAASACWICHRQADLLGRVDDEDRADRESDTAVFSETIEVVLRYHVVEESNVAVGIGDDWEGNLSVGDFIDVFDPVIVRSKIICALRCVS
jgi:hypothetical protein